MTEKKQLIGKLIGNKIQQLRLNCGEARKTLGKLDIQVPFISAVKEGVTDETQPPEE